MNESLIDEVEKLVALVERHHIGEITIRNERNRVTIRKSAPAVSSAKRGDSLVSISSAVSNSKSEGDGFSSAVEETQRYSITASMVGIYHHAEPPIGKGSMIERGQVVGVIETIKLMNDLVSDRSGVVDDILIEAGMPVEYGQPLFMIIENAP